MLVYDNQDFPEAAMKASWQVRQFLWTNSLISSDFKLLWQIIKSSIFFIVRKNPI